MNVGCEALSFPFRLLHFGTAEGFFEESGERFKSLTAVAKVVTGKHWNGYHFFNLRKNGGEK